MVWLRCLRGRKVILNGKCIGRTIQGKLCETLTVLDGVWIDRGLCGVRFISAEHICVLGESSVIVDAEGERLRMKPQQLMVRAVTIDGERIGAMVDAAIDKRTFAVREVAVNRGWMESLIHGFEKVHSFKYDIANRRIVVYPDWEKTEAVVK